MEKMIAANDNRPLSLDTNTGGSDFSVPTDIYTANVQEILDIGIRQSSPTLRKIHNALKRVIIDKRIIQSTPEYKVWSPHDREIYVAEQINDGLFQIREGLMHIQSMSNISEVISILEENIFPTFHSIQSAVYQFPYSPYIDYTRIEEYTLHAIRILSKVFNISDSGMNAEEIAFEIGTIYQEELKKRTM